MKTRAEIISDIVNRLDTLSPILGIKPSTPLQDTDASAIILAGYHQKTGFSKFAYYLNHRKIIKAAVEFNELCQLINFLEALPVHSDPKIEGMDKALIDNFIKKSGGSHDHSVNIITSEINFAYTSEINQVLAELKDTHISEQVKWQAINGFLNKLQFALTFSSHARGKLLARYMDREFQAYNIAHKDLMFSTHSDIKQTLMTIPSLLDRGTSSRHIPAPEKKNLSFTWYLFGFIPLWTLGSVESAVETHRQNIIAASNEEDRIHQLKIRKIGEALQLAVNNANIAFKSFFDSLFARFTHEIKKSQEALQIADFRKDVPPSPPTSWLGWLWGNSSKTVVESTPRPGGTVDSASPS